ncbi:hypothetical protein M103_1147 [Bacteroides fragilis str. 1007-1-F |nr:hypothetical protein M101_4755 [Bacteroides fragilis str. 1007-1-F \
MADEQICFLLLKIHIGTGREPPHVTPHLHCIRNKIGK